jgi:leucyl-tRNA synthetase
MVDFKSMQDKWQKKWEEAKIFKVSENPKKKKFYCLEMFPYPSASFLHMGHVRNYSIGDVIARFKRMNGFNVLYPMGYDSFGLPAENAAKKANIHPREYTEKAIAMIMHYQKQLGLSYDWDRVIATHKPEYYKWNQYFFIKFFEKGLAYRKKAMVNFCVHDNTVLANEEVENGKCWRCGNEVVQKELDQWFLKTTAYADELLEDLSHIHWSEKLKSIQENWIGKSHGTMINFTLENGETFPIFTTRPDTIYGVTFMVIALNHPKLKELIKGTTYEETVNKFIDDSKKAEVAEDKVFLEKSGVFTGVYAINPLNNEKVPIYAGNFVVADYATGMIMAVPAHDQRDFEFAKKYNIPVKIVIQNKDHSLKTEKLHEAYSDAGALVNSSQFNGLSKEEAIEKISEHIEKNHLGKRTVQYKLKDWLISRQRYWGTPIPMLHCEKCGIVSVNEKDLPVLLPDDVDFSKLGNPLSTSKSFAYAQCPTCGGNARRETDTMGGFMDSSWYFLRYCSPERNDVPFDKDAVEYWMPVDQYVGGIEHAVGHLIYSRFFTKALRDMGMLNTDEPFASLFNQGVVYKDNKRMSKSHGNTVTQDEIAPKYGIDTARMFMLFVAGPDKDMEWNSQGIEGMYKFLVRLHGLFTDSPVNVVSSQKDQFLISKTNIIIKNFTNCIHDFKLNTAIIHLIEFTDYLIRNREHVSKNILDESLRALALLLNPFAPHLSEECWSLIGGEGFSSMQSWPEYREGYIDYALHYLEDMVDQVKKDIISVLALAKIENPNHITLIIAETWKYALYKEIAQLIGQHGKNSGTIVKELMHSDFKKHGQEIVKLVPKIVDKMPEYILSQDKEQEFLENNTHTLDFKCEIAIVRAEDSHEQKAKQAAPGKPAIVVK